MTVQEAGTLFSLEVEGGKEGIQEIDENIAVQLLRAAGGDDVTHLQVEDKGRTTQYKILKYHEQIIEEEGDATEALAAEVDEGHVAAMEAGTEDEVLEGKPNVHHGEDIHQQLGGQAIDNSEKVHRRCAIISRRHPFVSGRISFLLLPFNFNIHPKFSADDHVR